jgi:ribonuclease D
MKCDEADEAQRLVASSEDLEAIALSGDAADVAALHGWRRQVFGEDALKLRAGEVALAIKGRKLTLTPT